MASKAFKSVNPWTQVQWGSYQTASEAQIHDAIGRLSSSKVLTMPQRQERVYKLGELLQSNEYQMGKIISEEMGKPITQSKKEVRKTGELCKFFAEKAPEMLKAEEYEEGDITLGVMYEPLGTILTIQPYNFPLWLPMKFSAGALMAGNKVLLKPANNVAKVALTLSELAAQAGLQDYFETQLIPSGQVNKIIEDERIVGVTITGGKGAGQKVASHAGKNIKRVVLELGGSDPFILLPDADPVAAAKLGAWTRLQNCGQVCISTKRFIVHKNLHDVFLETLMKEIEENYQYGDPMDENTKLGPLARPDVVDDIEKQVQAGLRDGAKLLRGGKRREGTKANIYEVTVLDEVSPENTVFNEETFGPIVSITTGNSEEELIYLANRSKLGLGALIYTAESNIERAFREIVPQIQAGLVSINTPVLSHRFVPFGGVKESGFGKELGMDAIKEFSNAKSWFKKKV